MTRPPIAGFGLSAVRILVALAWSVPDWFVSFCAGACEH